MEVGLEAATYNEWGEVETVLIFEIQSETHCKVFQSKRNHKYSQKKPESKLRTNNAYQLGDGQVRRFPLVVYRNDTRPSLFVSV